MFGLLCFCVSVCLFVVYCGFGLCYLVLVAVALFVVGWLPGCC